MLMVCLPILNRYTHCLLLVHLLHKSLTWSSWFDLLYCVCNWLSGHEFMWTLGVGDGQGGLACCNSWGLKESDTTERLSWTDWTRVYLQKYRLGLIILNQYPPSSPHFTQGKVKILRMAYMVLHGLASCSLPELPSRCSLLLTLLQPRWLLPVCRTCQACSCFQTFALTVTSICRAFYRCPRGSSSHLPSSVLSCYLPLKAIPSQLPIWRLYSHVPHYLFIVCLPK